MTVVFQGQAHCHHCLKENPWALWPFSEGWSFVCQLCGFATVQVEKLRHCSAWKPLSSSESQALAFIHSKSSFFTIIFYSFLVVYNIYLFRQLAYFQCHLFLLPLLDGLQLSLSLSSMQFLFFPPFLVIVYLFYTILVFCLTYKIDINILHTFCINIGKYRSH